MNEESEAAIKWLKLLIAEYGLCYGACQVYQGTTPQVCYAGRPSYDFLYLSQNTSPLGRIQYLALVKEWDLPRRKSMSFRIGQKLLNKIFFGRRINSI